MVQNIPIIDFHCHFPVKDEDFGFPDYPVHKHPTFTGRGSRNQGEIWRKAYDFPKEIPATNDEDMANKWAKDMHMRLLTVARWEPPPSQPAVSR